MLLLLANPSYTSRLTTALTMLVLNQMLFTWVLEPLQIYEEVGSISKIRKEEVKEHA